MLFNKSKEELQKMQNSLQILKDSLEDEKTIKYELPIVVFAVGGNGSAILISILNNDKIGHHVDVMVEEEFEEDDTYFNVSPGIYKAQFNWFTKRDEQHGDYDCELVVNDMTAIFDYDKYAESLKEKGE